VIGLYDAKTPSGNIDKYPTRAYVQICSLLSENRLGVLNLLLAQTPLILQRSVEACFVDRLGPPFAPASQENLLGISRDIRGCDRAENVLGAY
jgi:hypothetical protein